MNPNVTGRVAVVTGASRGLGAGLAVHFAASGLHLGLCARHKPRLAVRTRPTAQAGHIVSSETPVLSAVDVTDREALARFADAVVERFGRIDLWVNNAGLLGPIAPLALADGAALAETIAVNVTGVANGSSVFAAHVRERPGRGVLVNISSGAATKPYEGWAAYCASKAAVDQLTRVVALEEARHGLAAYAVSPGLVDTEMQVSIRAADAAWFPERERFRRVAEEHRFNSPGWVAEHILALAFGTERPDSVTLRIPDQATATAPATVPVPVPASASAAERTPPVSGSGLAG
jgi:NAD(P)-dependent dehydrogenase (short-subunit alcohol dehydrogenase family)